MELSLDSENRELTIKSKEGKQYLIKESESKICKFLDTIFTNAEYTNDEHEISLDTESLDRVVEFLKHQEGNPMKQIKRPVTKEKFEETIMEDDTVIDEWYVNFVGQLSQKQITKLIYAANYLMIDDLIELLASKIAHNLMPFREDCEIEQHIEGYKLN